MLTAHSGVRLEENDPEGPVLLCQRKKFLGAVIQSATLRTALGMILASTLRVPLLMTATQKYILDLVTAPVEWSLESNELPNEEVVSCSLWFLPTVSVVHRGG